MDTLSDLSAHLLAKRQRDPFRWAPRLVQLDQAGLAHLGRLVGARAAGGAQQGAGCEQQQQRERGGICAASPPRPSPPPWALYTPPIMTW